MNNKTGTIVMQFDDILFNLFYEFEYEYDGYDRIKHKLYFDVWECTHLAVDDDYPLHGRQLDHALDLYYDDIYNMLVDKHDDNKL